MTVLDGVTIGAIVICAIYGFKSGLIRELCHLGSFFLGFIAAEYLHDFVAEIFFYRIGGTGAQVVAYLVVFVIVTAPIFILAHYLKTAVDTTRAKLADQIGGSLFGAFQGAVIVAVTLSVLICFTATATPEYVQKSRISAYVMNRVGALSLIVPKRCQDSAAAFLARESPRVVEEIDKLKRRKQ